MSNEAFTPGKWYAKGNCVRWKEREQFCPENLLNGLICKCIAPDGVPEAKEEVTANAALIAASPKMYKKLEEIYNAFFTLSFRALQSENEKGANWFMKKAMEIEKILREARGEE